MSFDFRDACHVLGYNEDGPAPHITERTCFRCQQSFVMVATREYVLQPICEDCQREIYATQERKMDKIVREWERGAA